MEDKQIKKALTLGSGEEGIGIESLGNGGGEVVEEEGCHSQDLCKETLEIHQSW